MKGDDHLPIPSSPFGEKRRRVSDAFSFLKDIGCRTELGSEGKCTTSDNASSEIEAAGNNLGREGKRRVHEFEQELRVCHRRHQADAMALLGNTATSTRFIKEYSVEEWLCESVVVLREGNTFVVLNLKGMQKHRKDTQYEKLNNLEYVREEIGRGRVIEYVGRLLEGNVYATRTFRFV